MSWRPFKNRKKEMQPPFWWTWLQAASKANGLRLSKWLQRKTAGLSPRQLKVTSILLMLVFAGWNSVVIIRAFQHPANHFVPEQIDVPRNVLPGERTGSPKLEDIKTWLDGLKADSAGRRLYDRALRERPGLMDSLLKLENIPPSFYVNENFCWFYPSL